MTTDDLSLPDGWRFVDLTANYRSAHRLFERNIPGLFSKIDSPDAGIEKGRRGWYLDGDPRSLEIWAGVKDTAGTLVAAAHVAPAWGYLDHFSIMPLATRPDSEWTTQFLREARTVQEFAVASEYRSRGIGQLLERHVAARAHANGCTYLHGFTSESADARAFFHSCGYTLMPENTGLPVPVMIGMPMKHDNSISGPGWWFYRKL